MRTESAASDSPIVRRFQCHRRADIPVRSNSSSLWHPLILATPRPFAMSLRTGMSARRSSAVSWSSYPSHLGLLIFNRNPNQICGGNAPLPFSQAVNGSTPHLDPLPSSDEGRGNPITPISRASAWVTECTGIASVLAGSSNQIRSADFQSAVSPNSIRQAAAGSQRHELFPVCGLEVRDTAD